MAQTQKDAWIDALAGRHHGEETEDTREAAAVRTYLKRRIAEDAGAPDSQRELRMINYLTAKGAFKRVAPAPTLAARLRGRLQRWLDATPKPQRWGWAAGLAVTVLFVPVMLQWSGLMSEQGGLAGEESQYRGQVDEARLQAVDPEAAARAIAARLQALGIAQRVYARQSVWVVEAKVPGDRRPQAQAELNSWNITIPESGILIVAVRRH